MQQMYAFSDSKQKYAYICINVLQAKNMQLAYVVDTHAYIPNGDTKLKTKTNILAELQWSAWTRGRIPQ